MKKQMKKIFLFMFLLFFGILQVFAVPSHAIIFMETVDSEEEMFEDTSEMGAITKDGYFTYNFIEENASLTLEKDAKMFLIDLNKYIDDEEGTILSDDREIEVNLNGDNAIDLIGSIADEDMVLRVQGDGSLKLQGVLEHNIPILNENDEVQYVVIINCLIYNEETKEYEDGQIFVMTEDDDYNLVTDISQVREIWDTIQLDPDVKISPTFNEDDVVLVPYVGEEYVPISKEWVEEHIKTDHIIDYNEDGSVTIRKPVEVESLSFNEKEMKLDKGDIRKLNVTISPSQADNKTLTWSSSNEKVVTVDTSGNLKAVGEGIATITVRSANGKIATCKVQVGDIVKGDLNNDGEANLTDILLLIKLYFGKIQLTDYYRIAGDMNYSNEIDLTDVLLLIKTYFGK